MSCTYALLKNNLYATYKLVTYVLEILITIRRFFENCVIWAAFFLEATYPNSNCYENVSHVGITVSIFSPIFNLTFSYDHENSMTIKRQRQKRKEEIENVVFTSLQRTTDHFWHGLQSRNSSCFTLFSKGFFFFLALAPSLYHFGAYDVRSHFGSSSGILFLAFFLSFSVWMWRLFTANKLLLFFFPLFMQYIHRVYVRP